MVVAITGGIGSGKSVVSQVLRVAGYPVYDCDIRAKQIMDHDPEIQKRLLEAFGTDVIVDGTVQRQVLSRKVFGNPEQLQILNDITHPAVRNDIKEWTKTQTVPVVFVETAILKESGIDSLVDAAWTVVAPVDVRIRRVMKRNDMAEDDVRKRIESQNSDLGFECPTYEIKNFGNDSILSQVDHLLKIMINKRNIKLNRL